MRVGNFKEVMDWQQYVDFLTGWAPTADWDCSFERVTEVDDRVHLELEEGSRMGNLSSVVNSPSVYEFGADVFLQMAPPGLTARGPRAVSGHEGPAGRARF